MLELANKDISKKNVSKIFIKDGYNKRRIGILKKVIEFLKKITGKS